MSRANLFKYLKYDKLTDKYCNDDCENCPVKEECKYISDHSYPWLLVIRDRILWLPYDICNIIANCMAKYKKTHYVCSVCGRIEAPYFENDEYYRASIIYEYGWWKAKSDTKTSLWICHHCMEHGFSPSSYNGLPLDYEHPREFTWDEWQDMIKTRNEKVMNNIKTKDPEYYMRHFHEEEV